MAKTTTDDLEAVRVISTALTGFSPDEQERILRWAREKLGLSTTSAATSPILPEVRPQQPTTLPQSVDFPQPPTTAKDLKSFVTSKSPKNDIQFAATVAYFYRFEAPQDQRKDEIDAVILQDACRLAGRARFNNAVLTLNNSKKQGLLDKGSERGKFALNTVGENLVAMTLPGQSNGSAKIPNARKSKRNSAKRKK